MKLSKPMCDQLEFAMSVLRENTDSKVATDQIADILNKMMDLSFTVRVIGKKTEDPGATWIMSVYPDISVIEKIINNINSMDDNTISELWKKNKNWTIELDERIFFNGSMFTNRELVAMLLHEIGHVIHSNSIPTRISNILNYEIAKNRNLYQGVAKTGIFRNMLALPILNMCVSSQSKNGSLKNEINADKFASSVGYRKDLMSAIDKVVSMSKGSYGKTNIDENLKTSMKFTNDSIEQFKARKDKLLKKNLFTLREYCESEYMEHTIDAILEDLFFKEGTQEDDKFKNNHLHKMMDKMEAEYMKEAFFGDKYPPIDPSTFDYIDIKTAGIKSLDDKMMLSVYIQSKIDMLNSYLKVLDSGNSSKAKKIPYTEDDILVLKDRLLQQKENVLNARIPGRNNGMLIAWPEGYEG